MRSKARSVQDERLRPKFSYDGSGGLAAIHRVGGVRLVIGASGIADYGMPENAAGYDQPIDFISSVVQIADEIKARIVP